MDVCMLAFLLQTRSEDIWMEGGGDPGAGKDISRWSPVTVS